MRHDPSDYAIEAEGLITNPYEGLVIGNGDLAASAVVLSQGPVLTLGKNDVWDSRLAGTTEGLALKHDDLIRLERDHGFASPLDATMMGKHTTEMDWPGRPQGVRVMYETPTFVKQTDDREIFVFDYAGPSPKRVGRIRLLHPGMSDARVTSTVDIERGLLSVRYDFGKGALSVEAFVHRNKNMVAVRVSAQGLAPWVRIFVEKEPDSSDPQMPLPKVQRTNDWKGTISQTIPAQYDVPPFSWHLAATCALPGDVKCSPVLDLAYGLRQDLFLEDGQAAVVTVGVATSRDGEGDAATRATELAGEANTARYQQERAEHERGWRAFWDASSVELSDRDLESVWYRSLYGFACHLKPGAMGPGLAANIAVDDASSWHGYFTWNHNVQKWYAPALVVNHAEWYDVFADVIRHTMPTFRHLARTIFGLEGVYCDLGSIPFTPPQRAFVNNKWGRALAMTGWLAHMLWQHWEYTGDRQWLRDKAYPYIREAAQFYAGYLDKYQKEDGDIYPSMRLEEPGWCKGFVGNRNVVTDLVMFRKALSVAVEASNILGVDKHDRTRWQEALPKVPDIEYGWTADGQGWYALCKDWDKVEAESADLPAGADTPMSSRLEHARTARWGGGGWFVYPGEHIDGDEEGGLAEVIRDMLRRVNLADLPKTISKFHAISSIMPVIRLGLIDKYPEIRSLLLNHRFRSGQFSPFSFGEGEYLRSPVNASWRIVENQYLGILGIAEMLLQSQGGVLRLFPYWPQDQAAAFRTFRARGGFTVSGSWEPEGRTMAATIVSDRDAPCRLRAASAAKVTVRCQGAEVAVRRAPREAAFDARAGASYQVSIVP